MPKYFKGEIDMKRSARHSELEGAVIVQVTVNDDDELYLLTSEGLEYKFYHSQECCESWGIEKQEGDWSDLLYTPILNAEERVVDLSHEEGADDLCEAYFYTFTTKKGTVQIVWRGESNGYYSVATDISVADIGFAGMCRRISEGRIDTPKE